MNVPDLSICKLQGRKAFREHGVTGLRANPYTEPAQGAENLAFKEGFSDERSMAQARALDEAVAYQKLTQREAPIDRAWAEKLLALNPITQEICNAT
jgi:hypothetical protein